MRWVLARIILYAMILCFGGLLASDGSKESAHLFVVIPSFNNSRWCEDNLESVFFQTYRNWTVYYVDDCSTDGTGDAVEAYVEKRGMRDKCRIIHNPSRVGAMENLYHAIHEADPHSVIVTFDGDDFLADMHVFQTVADAYADPDVWLTYGSYSYTPGGQRGVCAPLPREVLEHASIRTYPRWVTSQLRTFYAALFHKIKKEDLMVQGKFFEITYDVAIFLPMIEMASPNHIRYIDRITYLYNYLNPLSDTRRRKLQAATDKYIRTLSPYQPISELFEP